VIPAARLQAAIEVLERIAASRQPADQVLKAWGAANRYAGSKDRRAVADQVYRCLRGQGGQGGRRAVLASLVLDDGLALDEIAALFTGQGYAPHPLTAEEVAWLADLPDEARLPQFLETELERAFGADWPQEARGLLRTRAPVDLRINTLKAAPDTIAAVLEQTGLHFEPTAHSMLGLRLWGSPDLATLDAFRSGVLEVQDEGSQIAALLADARMGQTVIDYCAGGGGKTLALAAAMQGLGRLIACDIDATRLEAVPPRLLRAGARADLRLIGADSLDDLEGQAHRVLVDAPCSGSGTWRRRPEEAWRLTRAELMRLNAIQREVLGRAAALVRPGGRLIYVTCSVLPAENHDIAGGFAAAYPQFTPLPIAEVAATAPMLTEPARARLAALADGGPCVQLSPRRTGTDGFFIALFQRTS
jgi:16S rRNA (cytosine967-C5)-methyltransferase